MARSMAAVMAAMQRGEAHHLYGSLAPLYAFVYDRHFDYDDQFETVREAVNAGTDTILEAGCGHGALLARLTDAFDEVVGLDRSAAMTALARDRAPAATVLVGDAATVCLDREFDAVVMLGRSLSHVDSDEAAVALLENLAAHLRPGGVVVVDTFDRRGVKDGYEKADTFESDAYRVERDMTTFITDREAGRWGFETTYTLTDRETGESGVAEETMHLRAHAPADLEGSLDAAGFEGIELVRADEITLRAVATRGDF